MNIQDGLQKSPLQTMLETCLKTHISAILFNASLTQKTKKTHAHDCRRKLLQIGSTLRHQRCLDTQIGINYFPEVCLAFLSC